MVWIVDRENQFHGWSPLIPSRVGVEMISEHSRVVLTTPIPTESLEAGDVGTIVHVYKDGQAYEVEFVALDGHTTAVATVEATQVRPITSRDMTHTREISATLN
jgi:hypothetical protein